MRRPSVLLINRVYPPGRGSTGRMLSDLAHAFSKDGWQTYVLTTGAKASRERDGGIKVKRIKGAEKPRHDIWYIWIWFKLLITALRLPKTDLVVTMTDPPMMAVMGRWIAKARGVKHIHWCQDLYPDVFSALDVKLPAPILRQLKKISRRSMQQADKTIVIGRCMAKHLSYSGLDPRKITVIPNWPDQELLTPGEHLTEFSEALQNMPTVNGSKSYEEQLKDGPKFRILYAGNIGRAHPVDTILRAAEALGETHPEIEFVFVGDGPGYNRIADIRTKRGMLNTRLLPYQPNSRLKEVMESGDIHLISMKEEAAGCIVPSKLYSALSVGRPCIFIGPENCETAKVVQDFKAGVVVPQGNARLLVDAILNYRMNGEAWFKAHEGAMKAGQVFVPKDSLEAWLSRARDVVGVDTPGVGKTAHDIPSGLHEKQKKAAA